MSKNLKKSDVKSSRRSPRLNQVGSTVPTCGVKASLKLQNIKENYKNQRKNDMYGIEDVYEKAQNAKETKRGATGLVYDNRMVNHRCLWDPAHQECPDRFSKTLDRCEELGLVKRCQPVSVREATESELLTVHSQEHIDRLKQTDECLDEQRLEHFCSKYEAVYVHPETYRLALLSAGCTIQLVHEVCSGSVHNGMAIIRPPGHHAMHNEYNGYCFFNNVAIAAKHALDKLGVRRILIVDWDVHHGQASQRMFYEDPRVVYFSIHRYEHGEFWPNLRESEFDHVGNGPGAGYNFNLPLNATGMSDNDYMAIFHHVLLPMATEFQPELVIVSAGYDAALGCPEGEMAVTPACYAHLVSSLTPLASGKVAVILEGGYCVRSLAEGAALTLRALLGDPCPNLPPLSAPSYSIQESILNCIYSHRGFWRCFQWLASYNSRDRGSGGDAQNRHWPQVKWKFSGPYLEVFPTRGTCPVQTQDFKDEINRKLDRLIAETKLLKTKHDVCFVYDPKMMDHTNLKDPGHPEKPSRIQRIYEKHLEYNLLNRLHILQSRPATREDLLLVHEPIYVQEMEQLCSGCGTDQLTDDLKYKLAMMEKKDSVYIHPQSYNSACLAAGSLLQVVDSVMQGESRSGVATVRPPGHHAEPYAACGFCLFNNVSVAAKYALKNYDISRVLILDWDVHHGNGTQRVFLSDPQVLYMSIHRYDRGTFFPSSEDAAATVVGEGSGTGFTVNIPWNQKGMGNTEYVAAFQQVVLPIAYQFAPELVIVSAGFDAAVNDPLGGCKVTPEAYALFTSWLLPLAMGRVIVCLEGGYNLTSISYAMTLCTKALLGDPCPPVGLQWPMKASAAFDLRAVLDVQSIHWSAVNNKSLPKEDVLVDSVANTADLLDKLSLSDKKVVLYEETQDREASDNKVFGKQVPSDNPNKSNRLSDESKPGSSQGNAPGGSSITIQVTTTLDKILQELGMDEGFPVHPRHDCPHVAGAVTAVPAAGVDVAAPCVECGSDPCATVENWICLTCYTVHCGRVINEHMMFHSAQLAHPVVLGFADLSVWCYQCDSYIESPILYEAKNAAYTSKFGETMPNIYTQ